MISFPRTGGDRLRCSFHGDQATLAPSDCSSVSYCSINVHWYRHQAHSRQRFGSLGAIFRSPCALRVCCVRLTTCRGVSWTKRWKCLVSWTSNSSTCILGALYKLRVRIIEDFQTAQKTGKLKKDAFLQYLRCTFTQMVLQFSSTTQPVFFLTKNDENVD